MNNLLDDLEYDTFLVNETDVNQRLDKFLSLQYVNLSRSYIQTLITETYVFVNDKNEKASYKVELDDKITIFFKKDKDLDVQPENLPLDIVYQDQDIAIINKRVDMVVHPSAGHTKGTLVNAILYHIKDLSTINGVTRPGIVHRLDKDTSGLLVIAKNDHAHHFLAEQLKDHSMARTYLCLVKGILETKKGIVKTLIGRDKNNRLKNSVVKENGKMAITEFEVVKEYNQYTLLKCHLKTGRTHQIRVHMDFIHHPIINDPLYGINNKIAYQSNQLLHAYQLTLIHPTTHEKMTFTCDLPTYFKEALATIKE